MCVSRGRAGTPPQTYLIECHCRIIHQQHCIYHGFILLAVAVRVYNERLFLVIIVIESRWFILFLHLMKLYIRIYRNVCCYVTGKASLIVDAWKRFIRVVASCCARIHARLVASNIMSSLQSSIMDRITTGVALPVGSSSAAI